MRDWMMKAGLLLLACLVVLTSLWGPELLAGYQDRAALNRITVEQAAEGTEGYRYTMNSNEKLYILARCLNNQILPESDQSARTRVKTGTGEYEELSGTYAFVVNHQGPSDKEITNDEIFDICNREISALKDLGVLPETVKEVTDASYNAVLYSAIDVLEPRNNLSVWKVSLSTNKQNADKSNRLLDAYIDADTGKLYEFYVRTENSWKELEPDTIIQQWSGYLGLTGQEDYEDANPLLETTPYFQKYRFPGGEEESTIVTVGFYEGINELFLKITK